MRRKWTAANQLLSRLLTVLYYAYVFLFLLALAFPMLLVVYTSFQGSINLTWPPKAFSLDAYRKITPAYWNSLGLSLRMGVVATALSMLIAVPCAWALVRGSMGKRLRAAITNLVLIPTTLPELILGIALLQFFRPLGLTNTFYGLVLALTGALGLSMSLRYAEAVIQGVDPSLEEAALTLGASRMTVLRKITLPLIAVGVLFSSVFVFMSTLMTMLLVYFLAGPFTMPISVRLFTDIGERGILPQSVAMAAILIYVAVGFYILVTLFLGPSSFSSSSKMLNSK